MCGIFGIVDRTGGADADAWATMRRELAHRGPDDHGWLRWSIGGPVERGRGTPAGGPAHVLLGHTRLSIIDLSEGGWQPMSSDDGRYHLTFNGEIYNYLELRRELEATHHFRSESDSEVLLAAWSAWGPDCLVRLTGMFALCVLDTVERRVWFATDPFGIKPLVWVEAHGRLAFASELTALVEAGLTSRRIAAPQLYEYLRHGRVDHRPATMIDGVHRLPPGSLASFALDGSGGGLEPSSYWQLPGARDDMSFEEVVEDLRSRFRRSIELHVRSDVPVGTALSGGIDSSAILCTMRELLGRDAEIHAFSYVAQDQRWNEERWIDLVGAAAGATVHKVHVSADDLVAEADDLIRSQGEPFVSTSLLAQRHVFQAARAAGVPVLLDGQGADELFGGYRSYLAGQFAGLARHGRLVAAGRLAWNVSRRSDVQLTRQDVARTASAVLPAGGRRWLLDRAGMGPFPPWLDQGWFEGQGVDPSEPTSSSSLDDALTRAFSTTSLPQLLRYEDRNSMRFSVESRVPFLEPELVSAVFRYPSSALVGSDGLTKYAFREALRGSVPDAVLDRRDKVGFNTPEQRWLEELSPWVETVLQSDAMDRLPGLDRRACLDDWRALRTGDARFDWRFWRWVNAARWAELLDVT